VARVIVVVAAAVAAIVVVGGVEVEAVVPAGVDVAAGVVVAENGKSRQSRHSSVSVCSENQVRNLVY